MSRGLRVLFVEDNQDNTLLLLNELRRGGFDPVYEVVDEASSMQIALENQPWDVVIANYDLAQFNGLAALQLLKKTGFDMPFMIVLGEVGEDMAMSMMKAGAYDYLTRDNLSRLVPVVEQGLLKAAQRREQPQVQTVPAEGDECFRALVEHALDIISVLDADGLVRFISPATERILGHSPQKLLGRNIADLINRDDLPLALQFIEAILQEPEALHTAEFRIQHYDGSWRVMEVIGRNLLGDPVVQGIVINARDITGRKRVEEASRSGSEPSRQSQKMEALGRLAGAVAHDFNNILTVITGHSELLLHRHFNDNSLIRKEIEQIKVASEHATSLTRQLLAFSRQQVLQPRPLDLNAVVTNLDEMLQRLIGEDIELVIIPGRALGQVEADPGQLEQIILNLVINARDAMPQGGRLAIETASVELSQDNAHQPGLKTGPYVMLAISDTGSGMDAETQARIFDPFFTTKEKGTGLGLAIVHGIVNQSDGQIRVYSEPGQGTTFKIYLPQIKGTAEPAKQGQPPIEAVQGLETILVVEDEDALRALARQVLLGNGYRVLEAGHGPGAIQVSEQHAGPIHLLITDVILPGGMNGGELAKHIGSLRPEMKVLFMSGYTEDFIGPYGVLEPGIPFLQKPFSPTVFVRKVRQLLDGSNPD